MAIKPSDIIIYLDDERYLVDKLDYLGRPKKEYRYPVYWENFKQYSASLVERETVSNYKVLLEMKQNSLKTELAKLNIRYKESRQGTFLEFRSEADITFFKLQWS